MRGKNTTLSGFGRLGSGYSATMSTDLQDLIADVEVSIIDAVDRLSQAERGLLYVGVLDLEQQVHALHDALALVAESIASGSPSPDQ